MHALGFEPLAMLPFVAGARLRRRSVDLLQAAARRAARALRHRRAGAQRLAAAGRARASSTSRAGKLISTEADAFWLPDTAGTDYRRQHTKTTIVIDDLDLDAQALGYFHNAGYFALEGEDFATAFRSAAARIRPSCRSSPSSFGIDRCGPARRPSCARMSRALLREAPRAAADRQSGRALRHALRTRPADLQDAGARALSRVGVRDACASSARRSELLAALPARGSARSGARAGSGDGSDTIERSGAKTFILKAARAVNARSRSMPRRRSTSGRPRGRARCDALAQLQ